MRCLLAPVAYCLLKKEAASLCHFFKKLRAAFSKFTGYGSENSIRLHLKGNAFRMGKNGLLLEIEVKILDTSDRFLARKKSKQVPLKFNQRWFTLDETNTQEMEWEITKQFRKFSD